MRTGVVTAHRPRPSIVVGVGIGAVLLAGLVTQCVLAAARPGLFAAGHDTPNAVIGVLGDGLGALAVGVLLATRLPRNPIGWLLLGFAATNELTTGALAVAQAGYETPRHVSTLAQAALVFDNGVTAALFVTLLPIIALLPSGQIAPGWRRRLLWLAGFAFLGVAVGGIVQPRITDVTGHAQANPIGVAGTEAVEHVAVVASAVILLGYAIDAVIRGLRSRGLERQQMKFIGYGAAGTVVMLSVAVALPQSSTWSSAVWFVGSNLLAVAIGVALVRYRLYDLDRVVSRTLAYAVVTGILLGVYVGMVALTTRVLPFSSSVGVAASTLVAVALLNPVRRRVQRVVDRRFNRTRYDAEATLARFADQVGRRVASDDVVRDLIDVVQRSLEPAQAAVWLARTQEEAAR